MAANPIERFITGRDSVPDAGLRPFSGPTSRVSTGGTSGGSKAGRPKTGLQRGPVSLREPEPPDTSGSGIGAESRFRQNIDEFRRRAIERAGSEVSGSYDRAIGRIDEQIADERANLQFANQQYSQFFDSIAPGFKEAIDVARNTAQAQAAIEQVFTETGEQIDARYRSTAGRVRAVADAVSGGDADVADALNEAVYEFKGLIDDQLHLDRDNQLAMFNATSALAAAAAESQWRGTEGEGGREQYVTQKQYEKIIQDMMRARADAVQAKNDAVAKARSAAAAQFASDIPRSYAEYNGAVSATYLSQAGVPPSKASKAFEIMQFMYDNNMPTYTGLSAAAIAAEEAGVGFMDLGILDEMAEWEDQIEVGVQGMANWEGIYNDSVVNPTPGDPYDQFLSSYFEGRFGGASDKEAFQFANFTLEELGL